MPYTIDGNEVTGTNTSDNINLRNEFGSYTIYGLGGK